MQRININRAMGYLENIMAANLTARKQHVKTAVNDIQTAMIENTDYLSNSDKEILTAAVVTLSRLINTIDIKHDYILNL